MQSEIIVSSAITGVMAVITYMVKTMMGAFLAQVNSINTKQCEIVEEYMKTAAKSAEILEKVSRSLDETRDDHRKQMEILECLRR